MQTAAESPELMACRAQIDELLAHAMAQHRFTMVVMDIEGGEIDLIPLMDLQHVERFVLETHPQITGARSVRKLLRQMKSTYGLVSARNEDGVHLLVRQT